MGTSQLNQTGLNLRFLVLDISSFLFSFLVSFRPNRTDPTSLILDLETTQDIFQWSLLERYRSLILALIHSWFLLWFDLWSLLFDSISVLIFSSLHSSIHEFLFGFVIEWHLSKTLHLYFSLCTFSWHFPSILVFLNLYLLYHNFYIFIITLFISYIYYLGAIIHFYLYFIKIYIIFNILFIFYIILQIFISTFPQVYYLAFQSLSKSGTFLYSLIYGFYLWKTWLMDESPDDPRIKNESDDPRHEN